MLSTDNFRDWYAVVTQVLRCLVLEASVDIERAYTKPAPRRPNSASQHAVVEKVLDRTS